MTQERLSQRQADLLERVCLKRHEVVFRHFLGRLNPYERVEVSEPLAGQELIEARRTGSHGTWLRKVDRSFRPNTAESLRAKGLVRFDPRGPGSSTIRPTRTGINVYLSSLDKPALNDLDG